MRPSPSEQISEKHRVMKQAVLAVAALTSTGCAGLGSYQSPHTLEEGAVEFQLQPQFRGAVSSEGTGALPMLDMAVKYGIDGTSDFGVKLGASGLTFDYKRRLVKSDTLVVSIDPVIGGFFLGAGGVGGGFFTVGLPLIIGMQMGDKAELVLAPKLFFTNGMLTGLDSSASGAALNPGLSVGFALELGRTFRVMPEFSVAKPIVMSQGQSQAADGITFAFGVGFGFGGGHDGRKYRK